VRRIAREASAAPAASFKSDYRKSRLYWNLAFDGPTQKKNKIAEPAKASPRIAQAPCRTTRQSAKCGVPNFVPTLELALVGS
jgi:hypothetical protein